MHVRNEDSDLLFQSMEALLKRVVRLLCALAFIIREVLVGALVLGIRILLLLLALRVNGGGRGVFGRSIWDPQSKGTVITISRTDMSKARSELSHYCSIIRVL